MMYVIDFSKGFSSYHKSYTKDCQECRCFVVMYGEPRCYFGKKWKHIVPRRKERHCQFFRNERLELQK